MSEEFLEFLQRNRIVFPKLRLPLDKYTKLEHMAYNTSEKNAEQRFDQSEGCRLIYVGVVL